MSAGRRGKSFRKGPGRNQEVTRRPLQSQPQERAPGVHFREEEGQEGFPDAPSLPTMDCFGTAHKDTSCPTDHPERGRGRGTANQPEPDGASMTPGPRAPTRSAEFSRETWPDGFSSPRARGRLLGALLT